MAAKSATSRVEVDEDTGTVVIRPTAGRDPIDRAVRNAAQGEADDFQDALETIRELMGDQTRLLLFRRPAPGAGGSLAYVATLEGEDIENLMDNIRQSHGGGRYQIKIQVDGRVKSAKSFEIEGSPIVKGDEKKTDTGQADVMKLLIDQLNGKPGGGSNDLVVQMLTMQMNQQKQSSSNMIALATALAPVAVALLTQQKGDGPAAIMQALAPYINQPKAEPEGNKLADLFALLSTAKELVGGGPAEGAGDGFMHLATKFAPALLKGFEQAQNAPPAAPAPQPQLAYQPPRPPGMGGAPPRPPGVGAAPPRPAAPAAPAAAPGAVLPYMADPVLALVGEDVLFMARRNFEPGLAAEAVLDQVSKAGIAESDLLGLVVKFNASTDWVAELRIQGLDLSPYAPWARQFMDELVRQYAEQNDAEGDSAGPAGG